ncbi:Beta-1,4-xylanase [Seminavis robusta]|uniref:endo-1,4-beta-xylanase n=1 Tax=Seminavis robusta TaxID=568900 RepID=A0A9N8EKH5_9STRA|nr:Beta-1,4-xylanase [Seminavis robusta]|eukprot:Sro1111_g242470.1 Beta-1,4-xylanase (156) ;mRNA; f:26580-27047
MPTFELTKAALPEGVSLVWNEAIGNFSLADAKISAWVDLLQRYKDEGVPIDGIGVQGHSISKRQNLTEARAFLEKVVEMGYTVEITEVDAPITVFLGDDNNTDPLQEQADLFADYARVCIEFPNKTCKGITFWGLSDAYTWYDFSLPVRLPICLF